MRPCFLLAVGLFIALSPSIHGAKPSAPAVPVFRTSSSQYAVALRTTPELALRSRRPGTAPITLAGTKELALQPASFTPYDAYLGSVRRVINSVRGGNATMLAVCRLMKESHAFEYRPSDPYRAEPPALTEARRAGDCKAKALWLYEHLGDAAALYVIGKALRRAQTSHAWVYWRRDERWWILDPTNRAEPVAADSVPSDRYVAYYSYGKMGAYRHKATELYLAQDRGRAAVAVAAPGMKRRIVKQ